jgi:hypothetical protein
MPATYSYTNLNSEKTDKKESFDLVLSIIGLSGATVAAYSIDIINGGTGYGALILYPAALCMLIYRCITIPNKTKSNRRIRPRIINAGSGVPV